MKSLYSDSRVSLLQSFSLLLLSIAIVVIRYPSYLINPRIWAEESIYLETFFSSSNFIDGFDALIYPAYYVLISRISGLLASIVSPENAALVTTICGLIVLLIPISIILFGNSKYWTTLRQKIILSAFLIFSCSTGEIWMNSTNVGFIMAVATFLILIDENLGNFIKKMLYGLCLSLAILTGPISLLMSPFFLYRFIQKRESTFLIYCFLFLILGLFQISYFLISHNLETSVGNLNRGIFISNSVIESFFYWISPNIIFPLFGYFLTTGFRTLMIAGNQNSQQLNFLYESFPFSIETSMALISFLVLIAALFLAASMIGIYLYFLKHSNKDEKVYMLILFIYLSLILTALSLGGHGGYRYSYVTSFILLFYLLQRFLSKTSKFEEKLIKVAISFSLIMGVLEYYPRVISFSPDFRSAQEDEWPIWKNEVNSWKENSEHKPKIWPHLRMDTNIWPARSTVWEIDLNTPKTWNEAGRFRYSKEVKTYLGATKADEYEK
tara:strand:+ start:785 stop:2272 length:1488 start_codon:yes stop_codon:yes gene_type:complete